MPSSNDPSNPGAVIDAEFPEADPEPREWHDALSDDALESFHISVANVLRYFRYGHLPPNLLEVSRDFAGLAVLTAKRGSFHPASGAETTVSLRKLLEAKDAAVRAVL